MKVRALGVAEAQRASDRVDHLRRRVNASALLNPGVVLDADAREQAELFAAQTRDPPAPVLGHPHIFGFDLCPAGAQEFP